MAISHLLFMFSDPTGACIQLEKTTFTVTEGVNETVRICAEIYDPTPDQSSCPVVFDFEINLSVDGGKLSVITLTSINDQFFNHRRLSNGIWAVFSQSVCACSN